MGEPRNGQTPRLVESRREGGAFFALREAEELVIGTVLAYAESYPIVHFLKPQDFFYKKHSRLWEIIGKLYEEGRAVVPKLVQALYNNTVKNGDVLTDGEVEHLLAQRNPSALLQSAHLLMDAKNRRFLATKLHEALGNLEKGEAPETVIQELRRVEEGLYSWDEVLDPIDTIAEEALRFLEGTNYVPSGIGDLDELLAGGFVKGGMSVIAARPSMGKTALARKIVRHLVSKGGRVYWASYDQSPEQILLLEAARELRLPLHILRNLYGEDPELKEEVQRTVHEIKARWRNRVELDGRIAPVEILVQRAWRAHRRRPIDMLVIDYLQFVPSLNPRSTDIERVSATSKALKAFAVEAKVTVLALAQLSREVERRVNKRPVLADLRDSGQVEQDADVILFLHRPAYYDPEASAEEAEIIVGKNKLGPAGVCKVKWDPDMGEYL